MAGESLAAGPEAAIGFGSDFRVCADDIGLCSISITTEAYSKSHILEPNMMFAQIGPITMLVVLWIKFLSMIVPESNSV